MKTFLACLLSVAVGSFVGFQINESRFGKYTATFGPFDEAQTVTVDQARKIARAGAVRSGAVAALPNGKVHDFGVMSPEEKGEHTFVIRNDGQENLSLKLGASTCKCTLGELGDETLSPGSETEVKMSWTVLTNEKTFGQSAEVITNDPSNVAIKFEIVGKVVRSLEAVPSAIAIGEIAAGDSMELETRVFNYMESDIIPSDIRFSSEEINDLATIEVEPFEPSSDDGIHSEARQGFLIQASIAPGLRQGPISPNLDFGFQLADPTALESSDDDSRRSFPIAVSGRIVGALSMLETKQLRGIAGGGYLYEFGNLDDDADLKMSAFVRLKGDQADSTQLSIGQTGPEDIVSAELGKVLGSADSKVIQLTVRLRRSKKRVERLGLNREDYGFVYVESDNPKVPALKLRLKFSLPAR
ncbi:MAG: DUF1573 domain-containing protein [Planctomycetota bacterium]